MPHRAAQISIQLLSLVAFFLAAQTWVWWRSIGPVYSPTGYGFGITLIPTFCLLGVGFFLRRFWAGVATLILLVFGLHDSLTGPRGFEIWDFCALALAVFVAFLLFCAPESWIR